MNLFGIFNIVRQLRALDPDVLHEAAVTADLLPNIVTLHVHLCLQVALGDDSFNDRKWMVFIGT
jgi:hypothetical protein